MKKYLLIFWLSFSVNAFAVSPVERLLLINDLEIWLHSGKTLFDWSEAQDKDVQIFSDIKQPAHIYRDFKMNSIAAEEKYKATYQKFYGHTSSIEKNELGLPVIIFEIGYFDKIYVNALSKNEVLKLRVPNRVDLICLGFKVNSYGDINAACSMFNDHLRFIAVNSIQNLNKQNNLTLSLNQRVFLGKYLEAINKKIDPKFNQECAVIDSSNYEHCMSLLNDAIKHLTPNPN